MTPPCFLSVLGVFPPGGLAYRARDPELQGWWEQSRSEPPDEIPRLGLKLKKSGVTGKCRYCGKRCEGLARYSNGKRGEEGDTCLLCIADAWRHVFGVTPDWWGDLRVPKRPVGGHDRASQSSFAGIPVPP
jgi:hypothetical protein